MECSFFSFLEHVSFRDPNAKTHPFWPMCQMTTGHCVPSAGTTCITLGQLGLHLLEVCIWDLHNIATDLSALKATFKRPVYHNLPPLPSQSPICTAFLYVSEISSAPFIIMLSSIRTLNSRGLRVYRTYVLFPSRTLCFKSN